MVKIFLDSETTGVTPGLNFMHEIAGIIEVDGVIKDRFKFNMRPPDDRKIDERALAVAGVTLEQIKAYPDQNTVFRLFIKLLGKYIDRYVKNTRALMGGYNVAKFDNVFVYDWFNYNQSNAAFYFHAMTIDSAILASEYLATSGRFDALANQKLITVAEFLGITVDKTKTHGAVYDAELAYAIYLIVTGRMEEDEL